MAYTESRSRFRSSSRCSRKLIVGRSGPVVPRLGIDGRGGPLLVGGIGRRLLLGRRGIGPRDLGIERVSQIGGRLAEFSDTLAERASQLRKLLRSEDQQGDDEDDE